MAMNNTIETSARIVVRDVLALKKGEQFLIITNPSEDVMAVSRALFDAATEAGAESSLIIQHEKTQLDFANKTVLASFGALPEVCASISANKMGKDRVASEKPFLLGDQSFDHVFHYQMDGLRSLRAIWTPGITVDMFCRTAGIDYGLLNRRCSAICDILEGADRIHVTAPGGTDIVVPVAGRKPLRDDGDFRSGGTGGNIPAGEVFISPLPGKSEGVIVFDGSISLNEGDMIVENPVRVVYEKGFITSVTGGLEAEKLLASITAGEKTAFQFERDGKLPAGEGAVRSRNCRGLGELGIGLNPHAEIRGNMLEDEKAFHSCHFAIGSNYDNDAEAMIHLDCLVRNPTIRVIYPDGSDAYIEKDGMLSPSLEAIQ